MTTDPLRVARGAFAAYILGDKDGLRAVSHPDSVWTFPGDVDALPWVGVHRGLDITRFLDSVIDHVEVDEIRVEWCTVAGDRVFIHAVERLTSRATGQSCENRYVGVVTVRDDKVWRYDEFGDTAPIVRAFST